MCHQLKHSTINHDTIDFSVNDLFFVFSFAQKHLFWEIAKKLFCTSMEWDLCKEQSIDLYGEEGPKNLFYTTVYVALTDEISKINDIWKLGKHFDRIKMDSDIWGVENILTTGKKYDRHIKPVQSEYWFDTNAALNNNTFDKNVRESLIKIINNEKIYDNIDACHAIIEYLSRQNK